MVFVGGIILLLGLVFFGLEMSKTGLNLFEWNFSSAGWAGLILGLYGLSLIIISWFVDDGRRV